jgi:arsenate reductase
VSTISIRPATPDDFRAILALLDEASLPTQDLGNARPVHFWVAERDGRIDGAGGLEQYGDAGLLRSLVVSHSARGTGLGIALVETLEQAAATMGISQLVLLTRTARSFFEHRGYAVIPRETAPDAVRTSAEFRVFCPAPAVCMTKSLERATAATPGTSVMRVLFLCTGNSCRSILGEATFNHLAPSGWRAMSAGSKPTGRVHPRSLALLAREGIGIDGYFSKSWDDLPQTPDIVITVCASAAGEPCPVYLGPVLRTHWGVDDPAHATGTDDEIDAQFFKAYRTLRNRIEAFLALPLDQLRQDPARLKAELDRIGTTVG